MHSNCQKEKDDSTKIRRKKENREEEKKKERNTKETKIEFIVMKLLILSMDI